MNFAGFFQHKLFYKEHMHAYAGELNPDAFWLQILMKPGHGSRCSLNKILLITLTVPLSTQVYEIHKILGEPVNKDPEGQSILMT